MLPQIGGSEMLLIGLLALVVIGPKDLPKVLRQLGQWVGKIRGMANEFRSSFDEMARQSELDELRREVEAMRSGQVLTETQAALDASQVEVDAILNGERDYSPPPPLPEPELEAAPKPKRARKPRAPAP